MKVCRRELVVDNSHTAGDMSRSTGRQYIYMYVFCSCVLLLIIIIINCTHIDVDEYKSVHSTADRTRAHVKLACMTR